MPDSNHTWVWMAFFKKRLGQTHRQKTMWTPGEDSQLQAKEGGSTDSDPADTWTLDIEPPKLWENKLLFVKPPSLWSLWWHFWQTNSAQWHWLGDWGRSSLLLISLLLRWTSILWLAPLRHKTSPGAEENRIHSIHSFTVTAHVYWALWRTMCCSMFWVYQQGMCDHCLYGGLFVCVVR